MLSTTDKILLLDEVANTARSSWQIIIIGDDNLKNCPKGGLNDQAVLGYYTLKNLLSYSLMTACYALIDSGKRSYSLHHAASDSSLNISTKTKSHFEKCFQFRGKIATYRNNVVAHVNSRKSQSDWADMADIKHEEIDDFMHNAKSAIIGLAWDNKVSERALGITKPVRSHFYEYCRVTAKIDYERLLASKQST